MTNKDVNNFLRTLDPLIEAHTKIQQALDTMPEIEGCEIQQQSLIQAAHWIEMACNNWLLIGKNIIDYNQREWLGAFSGKEEV